MKTFDQQAAQGDILITRIDALPQGLREIAAENGRHIVAHSETGHHHVLPAQGVKLFQGEDPMLLFAVIDADIAELTHQRPFDTHETLGLRGGTYEIRRQREYTPEGWRRVED